VEQVLLSLIRRWSTLPVFPVRSELAEEEVMAALVLRGGAQITHEALLEFICQPRMPVFCWCRVISNSSKRCRRPRAAR